MNAVLPMATPLPARLRPAARRQLARHYVRRVMRVAGENAPFGERVILEAIAVDPELTRLWRELDMGTTAKDG